MYWQQCVDVLLAGGRCYMAALCIAGSLPLLSTLKHSRTLASMPRSRQLSTCITHMTPKGCYL